MRRGRMEAFSDGVLAIIITIMVLEMKAPQVDTIDAVVDSIPMFLSYILSFAYVGFYWNNHHHLLKCAEKINGKILCSNLYFLFWISMIPFGTSWLNKFYNSTIPVITYGIILFMTSIAYMVLQKLILNNMDEPHIKNAFGRDYKGKLTLVIYLIALPFAIYKPILSNLCYALVAVIWIIPDKRIEKAIEEYGHFE